MAKNKHNRVKINSIIGKDSSFSAVESFKATRTNLMFMLNNEKEKNSIVITSYAPMDGKTTTCINLAITFAQTGAKILIIDSDLRKPSVHKYLQVQSKPGLSDTLVNLSNEEPCIYKTETENLYVLPAGTIPPNPTELLMSDKMDKLLTDLKPLFDYIFIDTPPIGIVTDAAIIGSKALGVVNVVNCEKSKCEEVESIKSSLEQAGVNLIGCILNSVSAVSNKKKYRYRRSNYGFYGFYGYGYGSSSDYGYSYGGNKNEKEEPNPDIDELIDETKTKENK